MAPLKGPGEARNYDGNPILKPIPLTELTYSHLQYTGSNLRIGIIHARWNTKIISALLSGTKKSLHAAGVKDENITIQSVPGSYELPFATQQMIQAAQTQSTSAQNLLQSATDLLSSSTTDLSLEKEGKGKGKGSTGAFDAVISIGALIKGSTMHFEYISDAVSQGLMRVQLDTGCPVVFGLLTLLTEEQGLERAGIDEAGKGHNHGEDWGSAAVELGVKRKGWVEGKFVE